MFASRGLDVIVRIHTMERANELSRCLFSLFCQSYGPLRVIVAAQRFGKAAIAQLEALLQSYPASADFRICVYNRLEALPVDARSALLNEGIKRCEGRYLAFLDYDDVIYEHAYRTLINRLTNSGATVAFGSILTRVCTSDAHTLMTRKKLQLFDDNASLPELFLNNHCPIHSFVIDRKQIFLPDLWFDESLTRLEDYDFLLRLCAKYASCFAHKGTIVGDYYIKNDGSNSLDGSNAADSYGPERLAWLRARGHVQRTKKAIRLSAAVSRRLGVVNSVTPLSIAQFTAKKT